VTGDGPQADDEIRGDDDPRADSSPQSGSDSRAGEEPHSDSHERPAAADGGLDTHVAELDAARLDPAAMAAEPSGLDTLSTLLDRPSLARVYRRFEATASGSSENQRFPGSRESKILERLDPEGKPDNTILIDTV